jgi:transcriptional accessory protein Tex/SPT6
MDTSLPPAEPVAPAPDAPPENPPVVETPEVAVIDQQAPEASPEPAAEAQALPEAMPAPRTESVAIDLSRVAQDLQIRKVQVEAVVGLLDEGNTVPFITRYRRERTGGLPEDVVRRIRHRVDQLRHLAERKQTLLKSIANQNKLTEDLRESILAAENPKRLEDLYLPYKPKKRSPATDARDRGLEPLALAIWNRDPAAANLDELLPTIVNPEKGLNGVEDVMQGVGHIVSEMIAETAEIRGVLRMVLWDTGRFAVTKSETLPEGKGQEYKDYFQFTESIRHIPPHRVLAINRGEKENALKVKLEFDNDLVRRVTGERLPLTDHPHAARLHPIVEDALTQLVLPSLEREIRRELTERAQDYAIGVFARNLRSLLLQPPLKGCRVLAIDPGFRTGCRVVALDENGNVLEHAAIHPHQPQKKLAEARHKLEELIRKHQATVVAIGNGTACRETEELIASLIAEFDARRRGEIIPPPVESPAPVDAAPTVVSETPSAPPEASSPIVVGTTSPFAFSFTEAPPQLPSTSAEELPPTAPPVTDAFSLTSEVPPAFAGPSSGQAPMAFAPAVQKPAELPSLDGLLEPSPDLAYVIVNEAGASDYATSPVGREEFPSFDAPLRSTISIGRRLQDPLGELVKIDPQHVGVGLYQHDVHPKHLKESLAEVIESCVNHVGVDLNSAGVPLLKHIAGLNQHVAREIVEYRKQNGPFAGRENLKQVAGLGDQRWAQAVGFVKVNEVVEPLDMAWIHPESYALARQLLTELGFEPNVLREVNADHPLHQKLENISVDDLSGKLHVPPGTVIDLLDAIVRPGRDPRDDLPPPVFKKAVLKLEDLHPGMELKGTVLNVVPFGGFIDVGLKDSGLVHISQMANRYIKSPHEVVAVGDVVTVWVLNVDADRRRASLTMIPPGTERKPPERRPQRGERPPAERRPEGQGRSGPPRRGPRPPQRGERRPQPDHQPNGGEEKAPPRPPRQLPERKPPKPRPLPNISQAKKDGKEYLNTLGELAAFFKAREAPPPAAAPEPPVEQPPPPPSDAAEALQQPGE